MTGSAVLAALATFAVALGATAAARRLPALRLRLAALAIVAACAPALALIASGALMLDRHDEVVLGGFALAAALGTLLGAVLVARSVLRPLDDLRAAAMRMGAGDLSARAVPDGPAELRAVAASFNAMADDVESLVDARRELVAWASHDLRTPIAAVRAMLEAIEDGVAPADRYLPLVGEQVERLARIVDDLLELSTIGAGATPLERADVDVDALVRPALAGLGALAAPRGVRLLYERPEPPPVVRCAPETVGRVLANLLGNALRHAPDGSAVRVAVRALGADVEVAVEDEGQGFDREGLARAAEPFWRADSARLGDGAGLGLAIARGLVEANGGVLHVGNGATGARVAFTLPAGLPTGAAALPARP